MKELLKALQKYGIARLNSVQKVARDRILAGKNVIIAAPTGSGKTLAAMIPIFEKLLEEPKRIRCLYITPLRALNRDIFERIIRIGVEINIDVDVRHGDTPARIRSLQLRDPPHILITTPETLQALLVAKKFSEHLKNVDFVVVDEVHEIFNSKRGMQLDLALARLKELCRDFQFIGMSATANFTLYGAELLNFTLAKEYQFEVIFDEKKPLQRIKELSKKGSCIIFTNTRETAEMIAALLELDVHHSSLSKEIREKVEKEFKSGEKKVIVATSSLELGIDVGSVDFVIQYGSPRQVTKALQRVGRAGHRLGAKSVGYVVCPDINSYAEALAIADSLDFIEPRENYERCLDVLAHQIVGICFKPRDIFEIKRIVAASQFFSASDVERVIDFLLLHRFIKREEGKYYRTLKGLRYYFENLSTIPDERALPVIDKQENKKVGVLHESFVLRLHEGARFIMAGEIWRVVEIADKVYVVRDKGVAALPSWEGELIPVHEFIARKAARIRAKLLNDVVSDEKIAIEYKPGLVVIHAPFGSKINRTIGYCLASLLNTQYRSEQFYILLKDVFAKDVLQKLRELKNVAEIIRLSIRNSDLYLYKFVEVAKRFGIIRKDAELSYAIIRRLIEEYKDTVVDEEVMHELRVRYFDVDGAERILDSIRKGEIEVILRKATKLTEIALEWRWMSRKTEDLMQKVKQRLESTKLYFVCMRCFTVLGTYRAATEVKCSCGSHLIGFVPVKYKDVVRKVIEKQRKGKKLVGEELKLWNRLLNTAELYLYYGKLASIVCAGFGIGVKTAKRILEFHKDYDEIIRKVIEAERQYILTRGFWED